MILSLIMTGIAMGYSFNDRYWDKDYPSEESFELNSESFTGENMEPAVVEEHYTLGLHLLNTQSGAILHLPYDGPSGETQYGDGNNDHNTTLFIDYYDGTSIAKARHNAIGGALTDCDIAFYGTNLNGTIPWSFEADGAPEDTYDFTHTVVHELGHCIGMGHSEYEEAIMYAYSTKGSGWEKRNLHDDDITGIQELYGISQMSLQVVDWWIEDADGDGLASPGEDADIVVSIRNESTAHAYDVIGLITANHPAIHWTQTSISLGDLAPQTFEDTPSTVRFGFTVNQDCLPTGPIPFDVFFEDLSGHQQTVSDSFPLHCPPILTTLADGELQGCGCRTSTSPASWLALLVLLTLARRRDLLE